MLTRTICIIRKIAKNNRNIYHLYIPEVMRPLGKRVLLTYAPPDGTGHQGDIGCKSVTAGSTP